jgi:adenosine deaminase
MAFARDGPEPQHPLFEARAAERSANTAPEMRHLPTPPDLTPKCICLPHEGHGTIRALAMAMRESQQIAAEHQDLAAHAHRSGAEHHGKEDHLTGHESSRQALEHSNQAYLHTQEEHRGTRTEHGTHAANQQEIAALAYRLWQDRGCPEGSPEQDWSRAVEELQSRH